MAMYSGDGKYYRAKIVDVKNGRYLVHYVDFGDSKEWVQKSGLRA